MSGAPTTSPDLEKSPGQNTKASRTSSTEIQGLSIFRRVKKYIQNNNGSYIHADGGIYVLLNGRRIAITLDQNNTSLAELVLNAANTSTITPPSRVAIQRLQVEAKSKASSIIFKRFSAVSKDGKRVYVPDASGKLICISAESIELRENGSNQDKFWVEHPYGEPLMYSRSADAPALSRFEELLVHTQACVIPEMRWFVAMNEGLFPVIRDLCPARFLTVHLGPSQSGKTTGAERPSRLHGLGSVKGDFTPASYANLGDIGLLVLDNKEHENLTQPLIDFLLFLATGAERGRSNSDGEMRTRQLDRPVGVITSIEGLFKQELINRAVNIHYDAPALKLQRAPIERAIEAERHQIGSALLLVIQEYLKRPYDSVPSVPVPDFEEHFVALCNLLRAFARVAGKPEQWAEDIIAVWCAQLSRDSDDQDEDELEPLVRQLLNDAEAASETITPWEIMIREDFQWKEKTGTLFVFSNDMLFSDLDKLNHNRLRLPKTPAALGRRLRSAKFRSITVLDEKKAPQTPELKRTKEQRFIGLFRPDW
jgi:hypothetical protein